MTCLSSSKRIKHHNGSSGSLNQWFSNWLPTFVPILDEFLQNNELFFVLVIPGFAPCEIIFHDLPPLSSFHLMHILLYSFLVDIGLKTAVKLRPPLSPVHPKQLLFQLSLIAWSATPHPFSSGVVTWCPLPPSLALCQSRLYPNQWSTVPSPICTIGSVPISTARMVPYPVWYHTQPRYAGFSLGGKKPS